MPDIEIRPALLTDLNNLIQMEHYSMSGFVWQIDRTNEKGVITVAFREVKLPRAVKVDYPRSPEGLTQDWKNLKVLVACLGDESLGYIAFREVIDASTAWISNLVVREKYRRKGIGSALVRTAQELAQRRQMRRMVIEAQYKNAPAIHLAQKLGFDFSGYNDQYYASPDIALFFTRILR